MIILVCVAALPSPADQPQRSDPALELEAVPPEAGNRDARRRREKLLGPVRRSTATPIDVDMWISSSRCEMLTRTGQAASSPAAAAFLRMSKKLDLEVRPSNQHGKQGLMWAEL